MTPSVERQVLESIDLLRGELVAEKASRRSQVVKLAALLVVAGLLTTVGAAGTTAMVARRAAAQDGVVRARANCEAANAGERRALTKVREALEALVSNPEREAMLPPEQRAAAQAAAVRARLIGGEKLAPEPRDCVAEFPSP